MLLLLSQLLFILEQAGKIDFTNSKFQYMEVTWDHMTQPKKGAGGLANEGTTSDNFCLISFLCHIPSSHVALLINSSILSTCF